MTGRDVTTELPSSASGWGREGAAAEVSVRGGVHGWVGGVRMGRVSVGDGALNTFTPQQMQVITNMTHIITSVLISILMGRVLQDLHRHVLTTKSNINNLIAIQKKHE